MIALSLSEVAEAVGGRLTRGDGTVSGKVTVDSRVVAAGDASLPDGESTHVMTVSRRAS